MCLAGAGLLGNFVIYLLSRAIAVMVPRISYDAAGQKWYHWSSEQTGHSLQYFIAEYDLELLVSLLCLLIIAGFLLIFWKPLKKWGGHLHRAIRARKKASPPSAS